MSDAHYYNAMMPGSFAERLGIRARQVMFQDLMRLAAPGPDAKIADVGVSDVETDAANLFEKMYPYPEQITCCGLTSVGLPDALKDLIQFTQIEPGKPFPFEDGEFDLLVSNAVLEHVGTSEDQAFFLRESKRVAKMLFITVPHQFFPVEHHTGIPFLHYWPSLLRGAVAHMPQRRMWANPKTLSFFTSSRLRSLAQDAFGSSADIKVGSTGILPMPFASNLFLFVH